MFEVAVSWIFRVFFKVLLPIVVFSLGTLGVAAYGSTLPTFYSNFNYPTNLFSLGVFEIAKITMLNDGAVAVISALTLALITFVPILSKSSKIKKLESELARLKPALNRTQEIAQQQSAKLREHKDEAIDSCLHSFSKELGLKHTDRITIYYYSNSDNCFYLLKRYSKNPTFKEVHRTKFEKNDGIISLAWQNGKYIENKCPVFRRSPKQKHKYRNYLVNQYDYDADKVNGLTMKSCRYFGIAIEKLHNNIGVLLLESTESNFIEKLDENKLLEVLNEQQDKLIKHIEETLNSTELYGLSENIVTPERDAINILRER